MRSTPPTATTRAAMFTGQSLGFENVYSDGFAAFAMSMQESGLTNWDRIASFGSPSTGPIVTSGAAMLEEYLSIAGRFWRTTGGAAGTLQTTHVAEIAAWIAATGPTNGAIRCIVWNQGQTDVSGVTDLTKANKFRDQTVATWLALRTACNSVDIPSVKIIQQPLGRTFEPPIRPQVNFVRDAQLQAMALVSPNSAQVETWDLELRDEIHLTHQGYRNAGYRSAIMLQKLLGISGIETGPEISSIVRSGNNVAITIAVESGQTIVKPSNPCGFGFYNGLTRVIPTSWSWAGNVLTAIFPTSPSGYIVRFTDGYVIDWSSDSVIRYINAPSLNTAGLSGLLGLPLLSRLSVTLS